MHGNTYAVGGDSIRLDPKFTDGTDCTISEDINAGAHLKTTRASSTITHLRQPVTEFVFEFPELLLPVIEEIEYSFVRTPVICYDCINFIRCLLILEDFLAYRGCFQTASSPADPWVQHRAVRNGSSTVVVQMSGPVKGSVTSELLQRLFASALGRDSSCNSQCISFAQRAVVIAVRVAQAVHGMPKVQLWPEV